MNNESSMSLRFEIVPAQANEIEMAAYFLGLMSTEFKKDWDSSYPGWRERFIEYFAAKVNSEQGQVFYAWADKEIGEDKEVVASKSSSRMGSHKRLCPRASKFKRSSPEPISIFGI